MSILPQIGDLIIDTELNIIGIIIDKTRKRTEELEDAIDYISWKQEEQTSDKQFYMIALLEYCINN